VRVCACAYKYRVVEGVIVFACSCLVLVHHLRSRVRVSCVGIVMEAWVLCWCVIGISEGGEGVTTLSCRRCDGTGAILVPVPGLPVVVSKNKKYKKLNLFGVL
jgi:hypothetical protein